MFGRVAVSSLTMLESAKASSPSPSPFLRVVSYNVLSSHLCEADHFVKCKPADLEPATRLERIKEALRPQCEREAVICLQEVSAQWVGELTPFFESQGYTFVSGNYGSPFNGYMGVSLAWSNKRFEAEAVDINRAADAREWPPSLPKEKPPGPLLAAWQQLKRLWSSPPKKAFDVLHEARRRHNFLVSAKLRCKRSGQTFAVSTYHMPCLFGSDQKCQVMSIHAALAAQHALKFADGLPCVLAGDFNFGPESAAYQIIAEGSIAADHPHQPPLTSKNADGEVVEHSWRPIVHPPMVSAYVANGKRDPDFTNLAFTAFQKESDPPFVGTLDYIFLSKPHWKSLHTRPLPSREEVLPTCSSYPTADEPSDHVAIWADLDLDPKGGAA
jgi:2',5'-phosphodiesterase